MQVQDEFQELFNHMHQEHGVLLLHNEMIELIDLCVKLNNSLGDCERQPVSNHEQCESECDFYDNNLIFIGQNCDCKPEECKRLESKHSRSDATPCGS